MLGLEAIIIYLLGGNLLKKKSLKMLDDMEILLIELIILGFVLLMNLYIMKNLQNLEDLIQLYKAFD